MIIGLRNCADQWPWYQMYHWSSSSSPSNSRWNQLNCKIVAGKSSRWKLNDLTELEVTELTRLGVDKTAFAIQPRQENQGITIFTSQSKVLFDTQVHTHWLKWLIICSKLAAKNFDTSEFHHDKWNRYLMLGFVSADIPWNTTCNLELQRKDPAWRSNQVLPPATTHSNSYLREYKPTLDAIKR
jgi:hypothetical protein